MPEERGDGACCPGDPCWAGPGACWQARALCSRSLPGRCPSDGDDGTHHRGGLGPTRSQPGAWLWQGRVGSRGLCTAAPTASEKGPCSTLIPFVLIPEEGGAEASMTAFGISQAIFQPGLSAQHFPWPRTEDESLAHVPHARQDARHDGHQVNGQHPALPASVPPAPTAARPVQQGCTLLLRANPGGCRRGRLGRAGAWGYWDNCLRVGGELFGAAVHVYGAHGML